MEVNNAGVVLNVEVDGAGDAPPLVLLHGITSSSRTWAWLVPHLRDRWRTYRLDFRGHGRSARAPGQYHGPEYLADTVALCRAIGEPVVVIGHSLGGHTAAALVERHPDLVRAAILEDPPLPAEPGVVEGSLLGAFQLMRQSIPMLQQSGIAIDALAPILSASPTATGATFGTVLHPDALTTMAAEMLAVDATVLDPVLDGSIEMAHDRGASVQVPVLVITADPSQPDAACRPDDAHRFAASGDRVEVVVAHGAGHLIHDSLTHRAWFVDQVDRFLEPFTDR